MNKRAELTDVLIFMVTMFILAVGLFILMWVIPQMGTGLRIAGMNNSAEGINAINSLDTFPNMINNGFLIIFIGLILSILITSFLVRTHPIFMFLYIFFLGITILLSFYLGNAYHSFVTNPAFASTLTQATFLNLVMNNIAEITLAVGILSMIIVFAKFSTYGGTQQF
jgi:hypothetical protein